VANATNRKLPSVWRPTPPADPLAVEVSATLPMFYCPGKKFRLVNLRLFLALKTD
jgi:hypothetical protein